MNNGIGILISIGKWGGIYCLFGKEYWSKRICLGWVAITFFPMDGDIIMAFASKSVGVEAPHNVREFLNRSFLRKVKAANTSLTKDFQT